MAKKFNYIPWLIGGAAAWFLLRKPGTIQGIGGYKKGVQEKINEYILHNIDSEGYGRTLTNDRERIQFLMDTFKSEYGYNINRMGAYKAFVEWLSGLPSSINLPFYYYDIEKIGKQIGVLYENASQKKIDKFLENWFPFIATNVWKLARKYKVSIPYRA